MEIYDVLQLSAKLRVAPKTVRRYLVDGILRGRKVGKRWLVGEDALRQFLMEQDAGDNVRDYLATSDRP